LNLEGPPVTVEDLSERDHHRNLFGGLKSQQLGTRWPDFEGRAMQL
jgi:hypothetical protein